MKVTRTAQKINLNLVMDVPADVHKDMINLFSSEDGKQYTDECRNHTTTIRKKLEKFQEIAWKHGKQSLRIVCEPTGQYHNKLLRTARRMGFFTNLVQGESVNKFRMVESNDTGKTDQKDPRVIHTLAKLNKVITHRMLNEDYLCLRKLGKLYDEADVSLVRGKGRVDKILVELFCDYSFKKDFLYSNSGLALVEKYGCNPYKIITTGYTRFHKAMKKKVSRIREKTLQRLWEDAQSSVLNEQPSGYIDILEQQICILLDDVFRLEERKEKISKQMIEILERLRQDDPLIPPPTPHVLSEKNLARLLGETGPIGDFDSWRKLLRYGGLNINMKQSGRYKGQYKISKKGRALLRKVLSQIILPLITKKRLLGEYYHHKKDVEKQPGTKAMTAVMRKFLKKFYGWCRSGEPFNKVRFFKCESELLKAA